MCEGYQLEVLSLIKSLHAEEDDITDIMQCCRKNQTDCFVLTESCQIMFNIIRTEQNYPSAGINNIIHRQHQPKSSDTVGGFILF